MIFYVVTPRRLINGYQLYEEKYRIVLPFVNDLQDINCITTEDTILILTAVKPQACNDLSMFFFCVVTPIGIISF